MASVKRSLNVGVVGMGRMGVPISRNLAFKSRNAMYLQLHSRSLARAKEVSNSLALDGAQCAMRLHNKYSTMTKWCDVILAAVADIKASRNVMLDAPDALLTNARQGQIIVDHTTLDRETALEYSHVAASRGAIFMDAPMSGNPQSALNGQLTLMVGGENESYLKCLPLFRLYADTIHRMGYAGAGSATKGIISMLVAVHSAAAAEAVQMAHATGIDGSENLLKVLDASWGSSTMLRRNASSTQRLLRNPEQTPPVSSTTINSVLNDVGLVGDGSGQIFDGPVITLRNPLESRQKPMSKGLFGGGNNRGGGGGEEGGPSYSFPLLHTAATMLSKGALAGVGDRDISGVVNFLDTTVVASSENGSSRYAVQPTSREESSQYATMIEQHERLDDEQEAKQRKNALGNVKKSDALGAGVGKDVETKKVLATYDEEIEFY